MPLGLRPEVVLAEQVSRFWGREDLDGAEGPGSPFREAHLHFTVSSWCNDPVQRVYSVTLAFPPARDSVPPPPVQGGGLPSGASREPILRDTRGPSVPGESGTGRNGGWWVR